MDTTFTGAELRIAAKQAITLALMTFCPDTRKSFLLRAENLLAEADALESAGFDLMRDAKAPSTLGETSRSDTSRTKPQSQHAH